MANYKELVPFVLSWEGGVSDHPADKGGLTNKGVTMATWRGYCAKKGKPATEKTLRAMTQSEWEEIFKAGYWDKCKADEIGDQSVANMLVDWVYNAGSNAIVRTQRLLGVTADGIVGQKTLAALNARSPLPLFGAIRAARLAYYEALARANKSQAAFLKGWKRRTEGITYGGLRLNK